MSVLQTTSFNKNLVNTINEYNLLQDRLPGDTLVLPYQWDDISIKANDFVVADTINHSIELIYTNWLYMLSYSVVPTNDIPNYTEATYMMLDKGNGVEWTGQDEYDSTVQNGELEHIKNIVKLQNVINPFNYNIIASTTTNLILLSGTDVTSIDVIVNSDALGSVIRSDSSVTHPSNGIYFESIVDLEVTDSVDLFVLDDSHRTIFKFDISGITTLDEAILKNDTPGRLLVGMMGGDGDLSSKTKFYKPVAMVSVKDSLFVLDYNNVSNECTVKEFDLFLNWRQSYNLGVISDMSAVDINYNAGTDMFYILCHDIGINRPAEFISFTRTFEFSANQPLMNLIKHGTEMSTEQHKRIYFSIENKNIMYLVTNKNVYKKYVSRPESFIGRFKFDDQVRGTIGPDDSVRELNDLTIFEVKQTDGNVTYMKDEILLYEGYSNGVYRFLEDSGFENSLESEIDEKVLDFDEIKISPDENVDIIVYNKLLYKTIYNNLLLLENTSRKFSTVYDSRGFSVYLGFQYLNNDELKLLNYTITPDCFVSNNEIVCTETINRCLRKIYDLQLDIMENMQEKSINVFPLVDVPIILD